MLRHEIAILVLLLVVAVPLRMVGLSDYPVRIHNDEVSCGLEYLRFLSWSPPPLFEAGWFGHPNLGYFLPSLVMQAAGDGIWGLRMTGVIFGMLSLLATFLLIRELYNTKVALVLTGLNVFYHWHLHLSRTGFHYTSALAACMWALYAGVRAVRVNSLCAFALAGIATGVALQMYASAFLLPIVLVIWGIFLILARREKVSNLLRGGLVWGLGTFVTYLPIGLYFLNHPEILTGRAREVYIFNPLNAEHLISVYGTTERLSVLWHQLHALLNFIAYGGDGSLQYGFSGRYINLALLAPAAIGALLTFLKRENWSSSFLIWAWLGGVLSIGGLITIDPPFTPRLNGISTLLLAFSALGICALADLLNNLWPSRANLVFWSVSLLAVVLSAYFDLNAYFVQFRNQFPPEAREQIVRILDQHREIRSVVNLSPTVEEFAHQAYQFIRPDLKGVNLKEAAELKSALSEIAHPVLIVFPPDMNEEMNLRDDATITERGEVSDVKLGVPFEWIVAR